jgi:hypothetical protein
MIPLSPESGFLSILSRNFDIVFVLVVLVLEDWGDGVMKQWSIGLLRIALA